MAAPYLVFADVPAAIGADVAPSLAPSIPSSASTTASASSEKGRSEKGRWSPNTDPNQWAAEESPGHVPGFFYALESFLRNAKFSSPFRFPQ